jgi:hypothetical protein
MICLKNSWMVAATGLTTAKMRPPHVSKNLARHELIWTIFMTTLNFYEKPVMLDRNMHRNMRLRTSPNGYAYAASTIAIPLAPIEFVQAVFEYPIVFTLNENGPGTPIALVGVRENENLLVDENGKWLAEYVPAFVRRYPFVLNIDPTTGAPTVLIDEAFDGIGLTDGDRLFEEDGSETPMLKNTLAFLGDFKQQSEFSDQFMAHLKKYDLLIPQGIAVNQGSEQSITLDGFCIVDEKRLMALDDAATLELARSGDLARIYTHLLSLGNVNRLVQRLPPKLPSKPAA